MPHTKTFIQNNKLNIYLFFKYRQISETGACRDRAGCPRKNACAEILRDFIIIKLLSNRLILLYQ